MNDRFVIKYKRGNVGSPPSISHRSKKGRLAGDKNSYIMYVRRSLKFRVYVKT